MSSDLFIMVLKRISISPWAEFWITRERVSLIWIKSTQKLRLLLEVPLMFCVTVRDLRQRKTIKDETLYTKPAALSEQQVMKS